MPSSILVTGVSGFLGGNLAQHLQRHDWPVWGTHHAKPVKFEGHRGPWPWTSACRTPSPGYWMRPSRTPSSTRLPWRRPMTAPPMSPPPARSTCRAPSCWRPPAPRRGIKLVFTSTDLVFSGDRAFQSENDPVKPLGVYGRSKVDAEVAVLDASAAGPLVVRLPLTYGWGRGPAKGRNFAENGCAAMLTGGKVQAFTDQWRTPLYVEDAATALRLLLEKDACRASCTWPAPTASTATSWACSWRRPSAWRPKPVIASSVNDTVYRDPRPADVSLSIERLKGLHRLHALGAGRRHRRDAPRPPAPSLTLSAFVLAGSPRPATEHPTKDYPHHGHLKSPLSALLRYNPAKVRDLGVAVAPPYDIISPREQEFYYDLNPYNVIRLDFGKKLGSDDAKNNKYSRAAKLLSLWRGQGILTQDPKPAIYLASQDYVAPGGKKMTFVGVYALLKLEDYKTGVVKPHEKTLSKPKADRLDLTKATQANFSPIFFLFDDKGAKAAKWMAAQMKKKPTVAFTTPSGEKNKVWVVDQPKAIQAFTALQAKQSAYIADGHHRYETMLRYSKEAPKAVKAAAAQTLVCLTPFQNPGLIILPTHRLVTGLKSFNEAKLKQSLATDFEVKAQPTLEAPGKGHGPRRQGRPHGQARQGTPRLRPLP